MSKLWDMVSSYDDLDPFELARAVRQETALGDARTRQLIYEATRALQAWNFELPKPPLNVEPVTKFPSLKRRIGLVTTSAQILAFLREIGAQLTTEARIVIGGSSALILDELLQRVTHDVDVVDEIPPVIRELRAKLVKNEELHKLHLAHFQSHYLPEKWQERLVSLPSMRRLQAYRVSSIDVFVGKLFSRRDKDRSDLLALSARLDREKAREHLRNYGRKLWDDAALRENLQHNWYVLYGEELSEL